MKRLIQLLIFILLTIITQVGGIIFILSTFLFLKNTPYKKLKNITIFIGIYLTATFILIPPIASFFGREKINNSSFVSSHSYLTIVLNRNYVSTTLNKSLQTIGKKFNDKYPNLQLVYLDANFPFFNGFPLLPHLSHNDGKKIDLSFIYKNKEGKHTNQKPSNSGYGSFEPPKEQEKNTTNFCKSKGYWQYDFTKYLTFGSNENLIFSDTANTFLIYLIAKDKNVQKIFIEPHLKKRLSISSIKVRFQGCKAVRHDDHIHFQIY